VYVDVNDHSFGLALLAMGIDLFYLVLSCDMTLDMLIRDLNSGACEIFFFFFFFFFFFYCPFNPLWVLAFSVIFFHSALFSRCFLRHLTPIICKSSSVPAVYIFRGFPLVLIRIGCHCNIF
jgi:chromate transport protein ChrA